MEPTPRSVFLNVDGVSCYANSITQIILNVPQFCYEINRHEKPGPVTNQLQQLLMDMSNKKSPLYTLPLRCTVGEQYAQIEQRDACEFLLDLLQRLTTENTSIYELVNGLEGQEEICINSPQCTHPVKIGFDPFQVFTIYLPVHTFQNKTLTSFKEMVQQWHLFDKLCPLCHCALRRRTILRAAGHFLFLSLCLFHRQNQRVSARVTDFNPDDVELAGNHYKVIGAVCHVGETTQSGHYWCTLRVNQKWLYISDENICSKPQFIENLQNVYVMLLEKIAISEE